MTMVGALLPVAGSAGSALTLGSNLRQPVPPRWRSSTRCSPLRSRRWPGPSSSGWPRASRRCSAASRARSPAWWRSCRRRASRRSDGCARHRRRGRPGCLWAVSWLKAKLGYDDALDVFGIHAIGGTVGAIGTGIFVNPKLGGTGVRLTTSPTTVGDFDAKAQIVEPALGRRYRAGVVRRSWPSRSSSS